MNRWSGRLSQAVCVWFFVALTMASGNVSAQNESQQPTFKPEEIEALVAPIALYPDSVLSQVLMASTYPLEIVHAARWVKANPNIKGDAAVKAVQDQTWDVSVKSLVAFPQVLEPMNEKIDWTQKLGDAFLAQEKDVLAAVQRLRAKAQESGNLKSNEQQNVIVEPAPAGAQTTTQTIVRIEPSNPEVIYVPAYNPTVVYGTWGYPTYPPYYWPPSPAYYPGAALATGLAWGVGLAAAGAIFGNCNWGGGDVNINVNKAANIDRNFDRTKVQGGKWQHDGSHRQGVAYRDNASREKFGNNVSGADRRNDYRGRNGDVGDRGGAGNRQGAGDRGDAGNRQGAGDRGGAGNRAGGANNAGVANRAGGANNAGAGNRGGAGNAAGVSNRAGGTGNAGVGNHAATSNRASAGGSRDGAFQGVGGGGASQQDFNRGRASAQSSTHNRPSGSGGARASGGGARAGGGGGGGGGRGRR
ncbi:DUF3300 domain-containing protein [Paraburkholderia saeva]|uniref:DUF3300 domain-containing protein n=1 Tax=Paraburkholderia saeva TaxID=2777537 RepID=A0A9N8RYQ4_9BURK|nr:DUF3300 domain-containing protein [Paraburkholderia saeva]CAG4892241.1 hypothetical protein R52603_01374 [Paraburkholderia saeva]CAG4904650.1 hypothetical protein LMG31841_03377 [Paraburkholderia saeva]